MQSLYNLIFIFFLPVSIAGQGIQFTDGSWNDIQKLAKESDKPIFVDAYTSWCAPCKWMASQVFTDPEVGEFYNAHFINYRLDMERGEGVEFAGHYDVRTYPTLLFLDSDMQMVHRVIGARKKDKFLEMGRIALDPEKRIANLNRLYESGERDPGFLRRYISTLVDAGLSPTEVAENYFSALRPEQLISAENFKLIQILRPSITNPQFQFVLSHQEEYGELINQEYIQSFIKETCKSDLLRMAYRGDPADFASGVEMVKAFALPYEDEILTYSYMKYGQKNHDYALFIENAKIFTKKYAGDDWMMFNNIAWDIYEDKHYAGEEYLNLGLDLARRSVKIEKNYFNADTYAALLYKTGDYKKAKSWAEEAIRLAKTADEDYSLTMELIENIEAKMKL